jgi:large subunit ribosomal protein L15
MKGQNSRSGHKGSGGFQGGQNSLLKSLPSMRGFTNIFRQEYAVVNLDQLASFPADTEVTPELLVETGLVRSAKSLIKVLGRGDLEAPLAVSAHAFSRSAQEKIEAAGGSVERMNRST